MGIDTETWRVRIGLYHAASVARHIKKQKLLEERFRCTEKFVWQMVNCSPSPCQFGLATLIILMCLHCSLDKRPIAGRRVTVRCKVVGTLFTVGVAIFNVAAVVYRCIVRLLLLLCGDVERNPGPSTLSDGDILKELGSVAEKWFEIGTQLKVPQTQLRQFELQHKSPSRLLAEVIHFWIRNGENISWDSIVTALRSDYVQESGLAKKLTKKFIESNGDGTQYPLPDEPRGADIAPTNGSKTPFSREDTPPQHKRRSGGCPPESIKCTFPMLETKVSPSKRKQLEEMLYIDSEDMMKRFANLFTSFFESLEKNGKISVKEVMAKLRTYGSYTPVFKGQQQPYLRHKIKSLPKDPDFWDVFDIVQEYCSFFNFELFSFLVNHCGTDQDKRNLAEYEKTFEEYVKRKVFECPAELGEISDSDQVGLLAVKLDGHYKDCAGNQLVLLKKKICDILHVTFAKICRVEPGCLRLTFQLPCHVLNSIFPLSEEQQQQLIALHVLFLKSGNYSFESKEYHELDEVKSQPRSKSSSFSSSGSCIECQKLDTESVKLLCDKHVICVDCLENQARLQPYNILNCTQCNPHYKARKSHPSQTFKESSSAPAKTNSTCWIFVYDSNIWIEAKKLQSQVKEFVTGEDHRVRIDMGKLGDVLAEGRTIVKGILYGSEPPRIDTVWQKIKEKGWEVVKGQRNQISGKEKQVHTHLVADVVETALTTPVELRSTIILVTGDSDVIPAIEGIFKHDSHWNIEVFMWKNAISRKFTEKDYGGRLTIKTLNDCLDKVTFTNMKFDISNDTLRKSVDENGVVFTMKPHVFVNHVPTYEWVRDLEKITKWPFQYYWFTDEEQTITDNLVVVFRHDEKAGKFDIDALLTKLETEMKSTSAAVPNSTMSKVRQVQTFKTFRENLKPQEMTMGQRKWVYYLEQPGQFSPDNVFQGFYNDAYIYYYKPVANIFQPYVDWYYNVSGVYV